MASLQGTVENIIYRNETNGYTVCDIDCDSSLVTAVGYMPFLSKGESVRISGFWTSHPEYGQQFKTEAYEKIMPRTVEMIEKYLSSGAIKGIGPATAKKIIEKFGGESLEIIQYNPQKLTGITGIGDSKAEMIGESFEEQREMMNVALFLQKYGIPSSYAARIYKVFGNGTIDIVKSNPYRLSDEVFGIGFKTADRIAMSLGIDHSSRYRLCSGIKYILSRAASSGHTYMPWDILRENAAGMLETDSESLEDALTALRLENTTVVERLEDEQRVYLASFHTAEVNAARKLAMIASRVSYNEDTDADSIIISAEREQNLCFAEQQRKAITEALCNGVLVITGGPGTGKTTIIKTIIRLFMDMDKRILLAAPTGRAARKMNETTGYEASTIHRLLEISYMGESEEQVFQRDESNPLDADVIIIDEMSMVDILLFNNLLKAVSPGTHLILAGDVEQLPSVGPGNVLRDIISGGLVTTVRLTEVFRQAQESRIIVNAHMINRGEVPEISNSDRDFFIIRKTEGTQILKAIVNLCCRRLPDNCGYDPMRDIQVLSPVKKGITGVENLNLELQKVLNPPLKDKPERTAGNYTYRCGDKVMQVKNNYRLKWSRRVNGQIEEGEGVFNGDTGIITGIGNDNRIITVAFDDGRIADYEFSVIDDIKPAYAITIHKSQGSEFPVVVMPLYKGPPVLMTRNLLYTAVTRAKDMVVLVGMEAVFESMIANVRETARFTGLADRFRREWSFREEDL